MHSQLNTSIGNGLPRPVVPGSISGLFEAAAAANPQAVALTWEGQSLSYRSLNERANRIANFLREEGVGAEDLVGIFLDRSFDLIAAILGILKAGGAYLPLDLACPPERLSFLLSDARAQIVLSDSALAGHLQGFPGKTICLDHELDRLNRLDSANLPGVTEGDDLAYVIYTSGSTGQPKGVMVTQENVVRLFSTTEDLYHFGANDVWSLFFSSAFDFSVWEIFGALFYGGRLVIVPHMVSRSASALRKLVLREGVTVLNQTPSAFRQFIAADQNAPASKTSLRYVIFGGEALEFESLRPWYERHGDKQPQCVNMYGITETTVHTTFYAVTLADLDQRGSNVGRALPDLQVYLVDEQGALVKPGEMGEMLVGGPGVARGYLNRPELTAQRFVPDTFGPNPEGRLYRSGDLARERPNGDLEYLGRRDHQVKVRGFRVELPEIESTLARHPSVRECAVLPHAERGEEPRLVAYLVLRSGMDVDVEHLRAHLAKTLPEYMIPSFFLFLPSFPLTLNGKLDRGALPKPGAERPHLASEFSEPRTQMEQRVARLWREALHQETVGADDNFFDLGGDSLMLTGLHQQLQRELKREIPITDLFSFPTIRRLAGHLGGDESAAATADARTNRAQQQRAAMARGRRVPANPPLSK